MSGLRTERVTLEITMPNGGREYHGDVSSWDWKAILSHGKNFFGPGESVRVVDDATVGSGDVFADVGCGSTGDEIVRLTAELEAAREECERRLAMCESMKRERDAAQFNVSCLKARVAELEASPAANAGGEQSQPPRGWLTAEERSLVESLRATFQQNADALRSAGPGGHVDNWERRVLLLDAILARSTPPRGWIHLSEDDCEALYLARAVLEGVFVGSWQEKHDAARRLVGIRERAIREAGGEVQDG